MEGDFHVPKPVGSLVHYGEGCVCVCVLTSPHYGGVCMYVCVSVCVLISTRYGGVCVCERMDADIHTLWRCICMCLC